jgi:hypothetical protein
MRKTAAPIRWSVTATVTYWDHASCDYVEVELEHESTAQMSGDAEDEAREAWSAHGYSPDKATVRPFEWIDD